MPDARRIIPSRGNPARPPFLVATCMVTAMLIGMNIALPLWGSGTGNIIFANVLWIPTSIVILWIVSRIGQRAENDRAGLVAGERWVQWQLSPVEYSLYARSENNWARGVAVAFFLLGIVLGVVTHAITGDILRTALFAGISLFLTGITLALDHAPGASANDQTLDVLIGPKGVLIGGRYLTFTAPGMTLLSIDLEYEEWALPVLVFRIRISAGRKRSYSNVRVPVPVDRIDEAKTIVQRFNEGTLPFGVSIDNSIPGAQVALR